MVRIKKPPQQASGSILRRLAPNTRLLVSERFVRHLNADRPDILYHYTSQEGLLGIASQAELWTTRIQYLNDTSEYQLGVELARNSITARLRRTDYARLKPTLLRMLSTLEDIAMPNLFVACFCERGDLLSQWRGYTEATCGYAIGFRSEILERASRSQGYTLARCVYDPLQQREIVDDAVELAAALAGQILDAGSNEKLERELGAVPDSFAEMLISCSSFFKPIAFQEEHEWRLVSGLVRDEQVHFRRGKSMITPFHRFRLGSEQLSTATRSIVVGPCPYPSSALEAVRLLLRGKPKRQRSEHGSQCEVRTSEIPYRNW